MEIEAYDPTGTGAVRVEVAPLGTEDFTVLDVRAAARRHTITWDTSQLAAGDWQIRATITDGE